MNMKKVKYLLIFIFVIAMFILCIYKFDKISIDEASLWFSIGLFLLAYFTKTESSILPFGSFGGVQMNGQSDFLRASNTILLEKNIEAKQKTSKKYQYNLSDNALSFFFLLLGILFMIVCIVSTFFLYYY